MNILENFSWATQQGPQTFLTPAEVEKEIYHFIDEAQDHFKKMLVLKERIEKLAKNMTTDCYGNIAFTKWDYNSNRIYTLMPFTENVDAVRQIMIDSRKMQKHAKAIHHLIKKSIKANQYFKYFKIEKKINDLFKTLVESSVIKSKEVEEVVLRVKGAFDYDLRRVSAYPDFVKNLKVIAIDEIHEAVAKAYIKLYNGLKRIPRILKNAANYRDEAVKESERVQTFVQKKALYEAHAAADRARAAKVKAVDLCFETLQFLHPSTSIPIEDDEVRSFKANKSIAEALKIANEAKKAADAVEECISKVPQESEEKMVMRWMGLNNLQTAHKKEELFQSFNVIKRMRVDSCVSDNFKQMISRADPVLQSKPHSLVGNPCSGPSLDDLG